MSATGWHETHILSTSASVSVAHFSSCSAVISLTGGSGTFAGFAIAGEVWGCGDDSAVSSAALKISAAPDTNQICFTFRN